MKCLCSWWRFRKKRYQWFTYPPGSVTLVRACRDCGLIVLKIDLRLERTAIPAKTQGS